MTDAVCHSHHHHDNTFRCWNRFAWKNEAWTDPWIASAVPNNWPCGGSFPHLNWSKTNVDLVLIDEYDMPGDGSPHLLPWFRLENHPSMCASSDSFHFCSNGETKGPRISSPWAVACVTRARSIPEHVHPPSSMNVHPNEAQNSAKCFGRYETFVESFAGPGPPCHQR